MSGVSLDLRPVAGFLFLICVAFSPPAFAQPGTANSLDLEGKGNAARALLQSSIDSSITPAAKAETERAMAMSWAFESNCATTIEDGQKVIDSSELDTAAKWYQRSQDPGLREPNISDDRKPLREFRLEHAQARLAARRGNRAEAEKHVAAAKSALESGIIEWRPLVQDTIHSQLTEFRSRRGNWRHYEEKPERSGP